jgi:hypothetical protein
MCILGWEIPQEISSLYNLTSDAMNRDFEARTNHVWFRWVWGRIFLVMCEFDDGYELNDDVFLCNSAEDVDAARHTLRKLKVEYFPPKCYILS